MHLDACLLCIHIDDSENRALYRTLPAGVISWAAVLAFLCGCGNVATCIWCGNLVKKSDQQPE